MLWQLHLAAGVLSSSSIVAFLEAGCLVGFSITLEVALAGDQMIIG